MINVRDIQLSELPSVPLERICDLPRTGGVYVVMGADVSVLYIGRSECLFRRWSSHGLKERLRQIGDVRIAWIITPEYGQLEAALIARFKPPMNDRLKISNLAPISTRAERRIFKQLKEESYLRGHTRSQALFEIIRLGLPLYLQKFAPKFRQVNTE